METTTIALIAAVVPSTVVGALGFFLRNAFADVKEGLANLSTELKALTAAQSEGQKEIAVLRAELANVRSDVDELKERSHKANNAIQALELKVPRGRK